MEGSNEKEWKQQKQRNNGRNGGFNGGNGGFQGRAGGGGKYEANEYCWSHGWCMHKGEHCFRRLPGHNTKATKENNMGGNPKGCRP